jgi:hypothetical protein
MTTRYLLPDYEPDYDAMWEEYIEHDEMAVFYATHERLEMGVSLGASAQNERTLSPGTTTTAHMRPVDETPEPAQNNGKPREL